MQGQGISLGVPKNHNPGYTAAQLAALSAAQRPNGGTVFSYGVDSNGNAIPGTTPAPAPVMPGASIQTPGFTPDWTASIQNDPGYQAALQAGDAAGIQNAAQRAQATQRALIQFGLVPDLAGSAAKLGLGSQALGFLGQDITPDVTALAQQNTANGLSTEAQLQRTQQQG